MGDPNPRGYRLFDVAVRSEADEVLLYGGHRIGKSETGGYIVSCYLEGYCPYTGRVYPKRARGWIVTDGDNVPVVLSKLRAWLVDDHIDKWNEGRGDWYIRMKSGAECWIKTHDQDRRKFRVGEALDFAWFDEEPTSDIHQEVQFRLIDRGGRMIWTLTPAEGSAVLHKHFRELDPQYREAMTGPFCFVSGGLRGNPYIPEDAKEKAIAKIAEQCKGNPDLYAIRVEGEYIVFSGSPIFSRERIDAARRKKDAKVGHLERLHYHTSGLPCEFIENEAGWLELWKYPDYSHDYVIGADVAMGLKDGDFSCGVVIDRDTLEVPAILHGPIPPKKLGYMLAELGWYFNTALVNPEANPPGNSTIDALLEVYYPRIFQREGASGKHVEIQRAYGSLTGPATKPAWVETVREIFAKDDFIIYSDELLEEMKWFRKVRRDDKSADPRHYQYHAISGHDDRSMAFIHAVIAHVKSPMTAVQIRERKETIDQKRVFDALENRGIDLEELGIRRS